MRDVLQKALPTFAGVLILAGSVFFLQGVGILPGSFMSGDSHWAVYGGIMIALGIIILWSARKR